jgi:preprotein translocase subunit SecD
LKRRDIYTLLFILALIGFSLWSILPLDGERFGRNGFQLGLDLKGGTHMVYQADLSKKDPGQSSEDAMKGVLQKIESRVNDYGVTEPVVQILGNDRILVQLPGVKDIDEAKKLIGQTAQLDFRETQTGTDGKLVLDANGQTAWFPAKGKGEDGQDKELTGKYLKPNAQVVIGQQKNDPEVAFEWNSEGARLFKQVTERNINKPLGIFMDNKLISYPTVQAVIQDKGVITGLKLDEARTMAIQLNSGSLDVPLKVIQESSINATLGEDSLNKSMLAGLIGLALIAVYMIVVYRVQGVIACLALIAYAIYNMAIFKLVPVVMTLPGIAGFIVSLGMAVDANILIFERVKEELRAGKTLSASVETGFQGAWTAIRDSNITTFVACVVLWWLGSTMGAFMVKGFAITLFIGVATSMFTAVTVSRTFLRILVSSKMINNLSSYGVSK